MSVEKAIKQHGEMENFFSGGFSVRGKLSPLPQNNDIKDDNMAAKDAATQLAKIAEEVKKCCKCGLNETRTNVVPGEGNPNAELVFVGEAPGADEDQQGRPFVGRAGKLLDDIIKAMNLRRSDVFICNILKCRPPDNRDPKPDEIIKCLPLLQKQLEIIKPKIIVALGAHAARTLLNNNDAIGKLRGHFHEYRFSENSEQVKLMPTYHPAYLLRNYSPDNRRRVWDDMKKVMAELGISAPY